MATTKSKQIYMSGLFRLPTNDRGENYEYEKKVLALWKELPPFAKQFEFAVNDVKHTAKIDWSSVTTLYEAQLDHYLSTSHIENRRSELHRLFFKEAKIPIEIDCDDSESLNLSLFSLESFLYDLFFVLNLSLPGSADFLNVRVGYSGAKIESDLKLSSYYFLDAFCTSDLWPKLNFIGPEIALDWYRKVRGGLNQLPSNPAESAIFSILHICRSDGRPEDIIWIFYAFESLFQTRPGENKSAIIERVCLLLNPTDKQKKLLSKNLEDMYKYRSKFVHGGLQVIHPMHNEVVDSKVNDEYGKIVELSMFGFRLLIACLQSLIQKKWAGVQFKVIIEPTNL